MMQPSRFRQFSKTLGPGILFASTCVGVSHLVQSTRAGAEYGFLLIGAVLLANVFKYPFFEFASRYTSATGKSLLDGYYQKHPWVLATYLLITAATMFIVTAAVTFVTAGLLSNLIGVALDIEVWTAIILALSVSIIIVGKFNVLDILLKIIGTVLVISTLLAFFSALYIGRPAPSPDFLPQSIQTKAGFIFLIALMGWMPTAVDMSTWTSLWTEERIKQTGYHPKLKETLLDFNIGYLTSAILALCFLSLGALVIYGSSVELSNSSPKFAHQLISMYTGVIGDYSYYIIAVCAFSTMFSTSITVIDGYSRSMARGFKLMIMRANHRSDPKSILSISAIVLSLGAYFVVARFLNNLKDLVDFATVVSFVIAPFAAYINYIMVMDPSLNPSFRPPFWLKILAIVGLAFLTGFSLLYFFVLYHG